MKPGSTRSSVAKTRRRLWEEPVRGTGAGGADDKDSDGGRAAMTRRLFGRLDVDSLKRELQVLSEQYSQKCLEIGQLTEKAEEREQTLQRCQQEGKQLLRKNQAREGLSLPAGTTEHLPSTGGCPCLTWLLKVPFLVIFFQYFTVACPQELQTRLSDEIGKLRSFISSRCSGDRPQNNERSSCELEVRG